MSANKVYVLQPDGNIDEFTCNGCFKSTLGNTKEIVELKMIFSKTEKPKLTYDRLTFADGRESLGKNVFLNIDDIYKCSK